MRLSEPIFACLQIAKRMEEAHRQRLQPHAGSASRPASSSAMGTTAGVSNPYRCLSGKLQFDLGAIGKGFALDRMGELLREWDCSSFLLIAGGSSILAGDPPADVAWLVLRTG